MKTSKIFVRGNRWSEIRHIVCRCVLYSNFTYLSKICVKKKNCKYIIKRWNDKRISMDFIFFCKYNMNIIYYNVLRNCDWSFNFNCSFKEGVHLILLDQSTSQVLEICISNPMRAGRKWWQRKLTFKRNFSAETTFFICKMWPTTLKEN